VTEDRKGSAKDKASKAVAAMGKVHAMPEVHNVDEALTLRQQQVLEVIRAWVSRFGYPPSVREIGEAVGLTSTSSVSHQLRALQRKGYLRRDANLRPAGRPDRRRRPHPRGAGHRGRLPVAEGDSR
jgi:repressor LexA